MATDINTQLQNISTDVTAIGNVVNRLLTIFSGGGVQNPDLATMKAELQGWTTTQLANYAKLDAASQYFSGFIISGNTFVLTHPNLPSTGWITSELETIHALWIHSKDNARAYSDLWGQVWRDSRSTSIHLNAISYNDNNEAITSDCYIYSSPTMQFFSFPTYTNLLDSSNKGVTTAFLNNLGNNVVHKTGTEAISGTKNFTVLTSTTTQPTINLNKLTSEGNFTSPWLIINGCIVVANNNVNEERRFSCIQQGVYKETQQTDFSIWSIPIKSDLTLSTTENIEFGTHINEGATKGEFFINVKKNNAIHTLFLASVSDNSVRPGVGQDNAIRLGIATARWSEVFAGNGTIQTSDKNLKTEIQNVPENVLRAWGKVNFKQFKFKDAVAKKGNNARTHIGLIANEDVDSVMKAFQSEGLDPKHYGLFCWDSWEDQYEDVKVVDKEAVFGDVKVVDTQAIYAPIYDKNMKEIGQKEVSPEQSHIERKEIEPEQSHMEKRLVKAAGSQYSLRYEQCLALECAYQRWILKKIADKVGMTI